MNATIRIAIHRLDTILGMRTLCIGSDVSILSRAHQKKEGSIIGGKRARDYILKTRAKRISKVIDLESSDEVRCVEMINSALRAS